jgi:Rrf2 family transcriptional regulator, iron-sulfur cluster assembly transcription factor
VREGILVGQRGPLGGYKLAKARKDISVYDVAEAVTAVEAEEPNEELSELLGAVVLPALMQAERCFASVLKRISLEDLVQAGTRQMLVSYKPDAIAG